MSIEQQIYVLIGLIGWMLLRHHKNAQKLARFEAMLEMLCEKMELEPPQKRRNSIRNFLFLVPVLFLVGGGCVHLPAVTSNPASRPATSKLALLDQTVTGPVKEAVEASQPPTSIASTAKKQASLLLLAAIGCLALCVLAVYRQHFFTAGCFGAAFLVLPIVGAIWAVYYAWIIAGGLVTVAVIAFIHYRAVIFPLAKQIER